MPYETKAKRERKKWLTGAEAIDHIRRSEHCNSPSAWRQLREAIADEEVPVKWDTDFKLNPVTFRYLDDDLPPNHESFWRNTPMKYSNGYVIDFVRPNSKEYALKNGGFYRPFLVGRGAVEKAWPLQKAAPAPKNETDPPAKPGRPSGQEAIRQTISRMKEEGFNFNTPQLALASEIAKRNGKSLGDKGWADRTVIAHISRLLPATS